LSEETIEATPVAETTEPVATEVGDKCECEACDCNVPTEEPSKTE